MKHLNPAIVCSHMFTIIYNIYMKIAAYIT